MNRAALLTLLALAAPAWAAPAAFAATSPADRVAAVVNDEPITAYEIDEDVRRALESGPPQMRKMDPAELRKIVLDRLIEDKIRAQEAAELKIVVSDEEVDKLIEEIRKDQGISQEELLATLDREGLSFEDYKKRLADQIQAQKFLARSFKRRQNVTAEQVEEFYDQHSERYTEPPKVRVAGILAAVPPNASEKEERAAKERAQAFRTELDAGASFEELAKQSQGPRPESGGVLGDLRETDLAPEFAAALQGIPDGAVAGPVRASAGWFILKRVRSFAPETAPLESIRARVERDAYQADMAEAFDEWMEKLKAKAKIEILE